jgi:two-component system phosphate regulon response regulator PhoB
MKVLIIEDEDILAKVLAEKMEKSGFEVAIAEDGEKALDLIKSFKPDIIMLDLMLPKLDGFEVLKQIKADDATKRIPIVAISNLSEDSNIEKALKLGVENYFVKSNHPINEIIEKVKAVLLNGVRK